MPDLRPLRLIARPRSWVHDHLAFVIILPLIIGALGGIYVGSRQERRICEIRLKAGHERQAMLSNMILSAFAKGRQRDHVNTQTLKGAE